MDDARKLDTSNLGEIKTFSTKWFDENTVGGARWLVSHLTRISTGLATALICFKPLDQRDKRDGGVDFATAIAIEVPLLG